MVSVADPNVTYKLAFADLTRKLGRVPNANECLPLHESYKRAFSDIASAAGPREQGFSREPAPQARAVDTQTRAREASEPLSGPTINAEEAERRSAPEPPANKPRPSDGLIEGDRGPGGGLMCKCQACGRLWERPRSKGRPAYRCEGCR